MSKKKTTEEFIQDAIKVHGDKYDYSKVNYINNRTKVIIHCPKHGDFLQAPHDHLSGKGCKECAKEKDSERKRLTTEEFLRRAKSVHGDKYDYSKTVYINEKVPVIIGCSIHGYFKQQPNCHLSGRGCPKCAIEKRGKDRKFTTEFFIEKAKSVHGDKYDYSKTEYIDSKHKVFIICKTCGYEFWQLPINHLNGFGCFKCGVISRANKQRKTTEEFIRDAIKIHGDKYDYSKTEYSGADKKVIINCPEHGDFKQKPSAHLTGQGCPICGGSKRLTTEEFISKAKLVHGNKYDYSLVNYVNAYTPITIICPEHKEFVQKPNDHLSGCGCQRCKMSKGERKIESFLLLSGIKYIYDDACLDFLKPQRPDFYLPDYNMIIEYDGEGHTEPVRFNGISLEEAKEKFEKIKKLDERKNKLCEENSVPILRISYKEFGYIEEILENYLV